MRVTDRHFLSADHKNHIHVKIWEPDETCRVSFRLHTA